MIAWLPSQNPTVLRRQFLHGNDNFVERIIFFSYPLDFYL